MKKTLIAFASLQAVAALAAVASRSPNAETLVLTPTTPGEQTNNLSIAPADSHETIVSALRNDKNFGYIAPIVTREMLENGRHPQGVIKRAPTANLRLNKKPRIISGDLNPVSLARGARSPAHAAQD